MKSKSGFGYSEGNRKMGDVYSISVAPGKTCAKGIPCSKYCYASKITRIRPTVRNSYDRNTDLLMNQHKYPELVEETVDVINRKGVTKFRFNVGGDFFSVEYLDSALQISSKCPDVKFWAFTKQWDIVRGMNEILKYEDWPKNFTLVLSSWGDYKPPEDLKAHFGVCYFGDKEGKYEIPPDAFVCGGGCETCMKCAGLKPTESVVIHQH